MEYNGEKLRTDAQIFEKCLILQGGKAIEFLVAYMNFLKEQDPELDNESAFTKAKNTILNKSRSYSKSVRLKIVKKFNF